MLSILKDILSTRVFDKKFRTDYKHYILQSLIIFFCLSLILLLCRFIHGIIVASLGASSFILFVTPHTNGSRARYVIGGYFCGSVSGLLFHFLHHKVSVMNFNNSEIVLIFLCAASVAVTTFLMVLMNFEHPPAAALALGLTYDSKCPRTVVTAIVSVILLCVIRRILKKHLKNLL